MNVSVRWIKTKWNRNHFSEYRTIICSLLNNFVNWLIRCYFLISLIFLRKLVHSFPWSNWSISIGTLILIGTIGPFPWPEHPSWWIRSAFAKATTRTFVHPATNILLEMDLTVCPIYYYYYYYYYYIIYYCYYYYALCMQWPHYNSVSCALLLLLLLCIMHAVTTL